MTQLSNGGTAGVHRQRHHHSQQNVPPGNRPKTAASVASMASSSSAGAGAAECVKVAVRCRPLAAAEIAQGHCSIVRADAARGCVEVHAPKEPNQPAKCFFYDAVYGEDSKQLELYDETVRGIVDSVLQGFNGTVFAYGQTGTGKTYTMEGERADPALRGVIPNAIEHIFQHIAHSPPNQQYLVRASFLEIYQEEIRDLLNRNANKRLELKERLDVGVYVKDLSSFVTKSVDEIEHVMNVGHSNRSVGRTNMNEHSSRSHAIFIVTVECSEMGPDGETHIRVGRLNLVDLAGSERQAKTGSEGQRFREATKINLSLSALGNVISALSDPHSAHIPYRDSKLTRLLQDSLGGNSKTVMIANIGPASYNLEETLSTLRYSSRAKQIENRPKVNEDPKDALLREFQDEIARLKAMLEERRHRRSPPPPEAQQKRLRGRRRAGEQEEEGKENNNASGNNDTAEKEAEEYAREQQQKLEAERQRLLRNGEIIEEERRRILAELEERERELEREREAQLAVAAKIRAMQSKLLSGDGNLLDRTRRQEELLRQRRTELAEQRRRERELAQRLEGQELEAAEIRHTHASLQQEVEAKRRKAHKLHTKLQSLRLDLQDVEGANGAERHSLEQTVLEMNKELALKWLLIDQFVPPTLVQRVRSQARFDEAEQRWSLGPDTSSSSTHSAASSSCNNHAITTVLPSSGSGGGGRVVERLNLALSPNPPPVAPAAMGDSGLGSSNGGSQGPPDDEATPLGQQPLLPNSAASASTSSSALHITKTTPLDLKRPIALSDARRPISAWELSALAKVRQRLARLRPPAVAGGHQKHRGQQTKRIVDADDLLPDLSIPEEVLRFGCENLLTFHSGACFVSEVQSTLISTTTEARPPPADPQRMVLDASRIPVLASRRGSYAGSRPGSAAGSRRSSLARSAIIQQQPNLQQQQQSKNVRARSVFSGVSTGRTEVGQKILKFFPIFTDACLPPKVDDNIGSGKRFRRKRSPPQEFRCTDFEQFNNSKRPWRRRRRPNPGVVSEGPRPGRRRRRSCRRQILSRSDERNQRRQRWERSRNGRDISNNEPPLWEKSYLSFGGSLEQVRLCPSAPMTMTSSMGTSTALSAGGHFCPNWCTNPTLRMAKKSRIPVLITPPKPNKSFMFNKLTNECTTVVPYFQMTLSTNSFRSSTSREQLSSPEEEENENCPRHWSPALERAASTLTKVHSGNKRPTNFRTPPAMLHPITTMPPATYSCSLMASTDSQSMAATISHCCMCSSSSCWLRLPDRPNREHSVDYGGVLFSSALGRVQAGRVHKRHKKRKDIRSEIKDRIPTELSMLRSSSDRSRRSQMHDLALLEWSIRFAGLALLLRLLQILLLE